MITSQEQKLGKSFEEIPPRDSWDPIDEAVYGPDDLFRVDVKDAERLRLRAIKFSLNRHYTRNRFYHTLCEQRGFTPEDVKTLDDLAKVPLIPYTIFKQYPQPDRLVAWLRGISSDDVKYPPVHGSSYAEIINQLNEHGLRVIFSSGSSGRSSFTVRDQITLPREKHYHLHMHRFWGSDPEEHVVYLGPDYMKIHPNWVIAHTDTNNARRFHKEGRLHFMINIDATADTVSTVMGETGHFHGKEMLARLKQEAGDKNELTFRLLEDLSEKGAAGSINAVPFTLNDFLSWMENSGKRLKLGDRWIIVVGGGWRGISKEAMYEKVERVLGMPDENFRDVYGMAESVPPYSECEGHYYHAGNTVLHPLVLDDELEPVGYGEVGRFALIEILAHAYPGCIVTEDKVKLLESCPSCDRPGPVLSPSVGRMQGAEDAGCAAMVRKLMEEEAAGR